MVDRPEDHGHGELRRRFARLPVPELGAIAGRHDGAFPGPRAYDVACRYGMQLTGLPGWHGKRFDTPAVDASTTDGVNLVADGEAKPMLARIAPSLTDGRPALVCTYQPQEAPPYRWVRDEFRAWDEQTLLGLAYLDLAVLRRVGFPFVLRRRRRDPVSDPRGSRPATAL